LFWSAVESAATTPLSGAFKYDMGWQKRGAGRYTTATMALAP